MTKTKTIIFAIIFNTLSLFYINTATPLMNGVKSGEYVFYYDYRNPTTSTYTGFLYLGAQDGKAHFVIRVMELGNMSVTKYRVIVRHDPEKNDFEIIGKEVMFGVETYHTQKSLTDLTHFLKVYHTYVPQFTINTEIEEYKRDYTKTKVYTFGSFFPLFRLKSIVNKLKNEEVYIIDRGGIIDNTNLHRFMEADPVNNSDIFHPSGDSRNLVSKQKNSLEYEDINYTLDENWVEKFFSDFKEYTLNYITIPQTELIIKTINWESLQKENYKTLIEFMRHNFLVDKSLIQLQTLEVSEESNSFDFSFLHASPELRIHMISKVKYFRVESQVYHIVLTIPLSLYKMNRNYFDEILDSIEIK